MKRTPFVAIVSLVPEARVPFAMRFENAGTRRRAGGLTERISIVAEAAANPEGRPIRATPAERRALVQAIAGIIERNREKARAGRRGHAHRTRQV